MATVTIDRLAKHYDGGKEAAVKDVSLAVADGEFMVLLGPSGCGKSSILRMIAGLEPITSGCISIDGRVVNHVPAKDRDIAMVFQSYALYPHMTVFHNLAFGLRRRSVSTAEIDRRVRGTAEKLGLAPFLDRKPHALSGGQRQRVALGRAIVRDPKVFLFDEPLSNLDAALRVSTRNDLIKQQHESGVTTIYVTHDQVEAMTMGHRICIMDHGKVIQVGRPLEVYGNPASTFVARFLGSPPMNLVAARLETVDGCVRLHVAGIEIAPTSWPTSALLPHTANGAVFGVRPEDLYELPAPGGVERFAQLAVRVVAVEPLGAETLLVLQTTATGEEVILRGGRETTLKAGQLTRIAIDTARIHLFDPASGRTIPAATP
jgi:multiple sugar transport system ATP-binding protein